MVAVVSAVLVLGLILVASPIELAQADTATTEPPYDPADPPAPILGWGNAVRNIVEGGSITVCTLDYSDSTRGAVSMWNEHLRGSDGPIHISTARTPFMSTDAFRLASPCPLDSQLGPTDHVSFVEVVARHPVDDADFYCGRRTAYGCVLITRRSNAPLYTFTGEIRVIMNEMRRPPNADTDGNRRTIAHELGHVLGISHPPGGIGDEGCAITDQLMAQTGCADNDPSYPPLEYELSLGDLDRYAQAYTPNMVGRRGGRPFAQAVSGHPGVVEFNFDASNVHVEKQIEIRRWDGPGTGWSDPLKSFGPETLEASWILRGQTLLPGETSRTYGIFSTTDAYIENQCTIDDVECDDAVDVKASKERIGFGQSTITPVTLSTGTPAAGFEIRTEVTGQGRITRNMAGPLYTSGTIVRLDTAAEPGWVFAGWSGDCSGIAPCDLTVTSDMDVTATFTITSHTLTTSWITITNDPVPVVQRGTTSPIDGTALHPLLPETVDYGSTRTVTAAWEHFRYEGERWGDACSGRTSSRCTLLIQADSHASARFWERPQLESLTVSGSNFAFNPDRRDYDVGVDDLQWPPTITATTVTGTSDGFTTNNPATAGDVSATDATVSVTGRRTATIGGMSVRRGPMTRTYELRLIPRNVRLRTLSLTDAMFTFSEATTTYDVTVGAGIATTTVTAEAVNGDASVSISVEDVEGAVIALPVATPTVTSTSIEVTVEDGGAIRTYTVNVTRPDDRPEFKDDTDTDIETVTVEFDGGIAGSEELPTARGGNGDLTYTLSEEGQPPRLRFDTATHSLEGTADNSGGTDLEYVLTLSVRDADANMADGDADTVEVKVVVKPDPRQTPPMALATALVSTDSSRVRVSFTPNARATRTLLQLHAWESDCIPGTTGCAIGDPVRTAQRTPSPYDFSGLTQGKYYRVRAASCYQAGGGASGAADGRGPRQEPPTIVCSSRWTDWSDALYLPLVPPAGLIVQAVSGDDDAVRVSFTRNTQAAGGTLLELYAAESSNGFCAPGTSDCTAVASHRTTASSHDFDGLSQNKYYRARGTSCLEATCGAGNTGAEGSAEHERSSQTATTRTWSAWSSAFFLPLVPPSAMTTAAVTGNSDAVRVGFTRNVQADSTRIELYQADTSTGFCTPGAEGCVAVATYTTGASSHDFDGLTLAKHYRARAASCVETTGTQGSREGARGSQEPQVTVCATGWSGWSSAFYLAPPPNALAPTGMQASGVPGDDDGIRVSFTRNTQADSTQIELYRADTSNGFCTPGSSGCSAAATYRTSRSSHDFGGLTQGKYYRVRGASCNETTGAQREAPDRKPRQEPQVTVCTTLWSGWSSAFYLPATFTLTVSPGTGGTTSPAAGAHTYREGASVTVTATANSGYRIGSWSGDCSGGGSTCTVTMNGDRSASVSFVRQYTLTTSDETGGSISPAPGTYTYDEDTPVALTATPDSGYRIGSWGGDCSGDGSTCSLTMDGDRTASVSFVRQYTLTTSDETGGSISPAPGTYTYDEDTPVTLTATPDSGYRIGSWGGDCSGDGSTCSLTMDGDRSASVSFVRQYTLTTSGTKGGSISPSPGRHSYDQGTTVTVTATPDDGYRIRSWAGDCSGRGTTCSLRMDDHRIASVSFEVDTTPAFALTTKRYHTIVGKRVSQLLPGATGGNGDLEYSLTGNLPPGMSFSSSTRHVSGAATSSAAGNAYWSTLTVTDADGDTDTLRIRIYIKDLFDLQILISPRGTGSATGAGRHNEDDVIGITATGADNYVFKKWTGDGIADTTIASTTVVMDDDKSITAHFEHICDSDSTHPICARGRSDHAGQPPTVTIDTASQTVAGEASIKLAATATAVNGEIASYSWSGTGTFSDATAEDVTWTAPAARSSEQRYSLTLTVATDAGATATATVEMVVAADPSADEDDGDQMDAPEPGE